MLSPRLFLIDTYGFIFRAYHARARMQTAPMRTSTGISTEAVFIFSNMLRKLEKSFAPEHIAAIFESVGPTLREQEFAEYKANRAEMPSDLPEQIRYVRRLIEALRIPILQYPGFEADDVIGTIASRAEKAGYEVVIVSSDKDMLQLVTDRVAMLNPAKEDTWYDPAKVREFMGVEPGQVADLLALKGDAIDNIPGVPGIGEKGAKDLIEKFGSIEAALDRAAEVDRKMYRESLQNNRDRILMSKKLATIETNVPIEVSLDDLYKHEPDIPALRQIYKELEFHSHLKELGPGQDTRTLDLGTLETAADVDEYLNRIPAGVPVAIALGGVPGDSIGVAWEPNKAKSVPFTFLDRLRPLLEDPGRPKIAADVKCTLLSLMKAGIDARGFEHDTSLYSFLLDADPSGSSLDRLVQRRFDLKLDGAVERQAVHLLDLHTLLMPEMEARNLRDLYGRIDLPLAPVLARMEHAGIRVDTVELSRLSDLMETQIARLTREIHQLAGKEFNIASPQQLGRVLFEDLNLPAPVKYGKGKVISTAADVLENLAADHEIVRKVLEFRQLTKLKGTYVDAIPALIDPRTGRIHTSFNPTGAATGRLSSSNPNLQNIPIKTDLGREIRAAFVPRDGWKLLIADYSQIELRLLAHMSRDRVLVEAFRNGEDIHTRTAAEVMGVPPMMVSRRERNNAKAVNFGIVYGISPFGLASQLGISRKEAELYIRNYFERYAGVRTFIDATIEEVRRTGVAKTLFGRERPIPDMNSRNPNARGFAERTAVNSPLQGTAADIIKLAMIRIDRELDKFEARMLLQVHDELVLEAPAAEADEVAKIVKREMEQVHPLEVPLVADVGIGANWRDAK
ncbi:MAG: DNA polymerase I [Bryobacteraceae bacterium]